MIKHLNGFEILKCILLINRLRPLLHSFSIDLMDSAREWPRANILLHANVRAYVESQLSRQLVVLNAWLGAWGPERRQRTARLVPGTKVLFLTNYDDTSKKVHVRCNESHIIALQYQTTLHCAHHPEISSCV